MIRALLATPRYTVPALLSLALGVAAATTVFAMFSAVMLRPLPFPDEDALVAVHMRTSQSDALRGISATYHRELGEQRAIFTSLAGYRREGVTVAAGGEPRHSSGTAVTPEFFATLRPAVERGRTFTADDPKTVAVVSHAFWAATGADTISINGVPYTVVGVIADDAALPADTEVWFPLELSEDDKNGRFRYALHGIGRLAVGVDRARDMLRAVGEAQNFHHGDGSLALATVTPLRDELLGDTHTSMWLMLAAVGAFLLLACANVASLMVTRASLRTHELAIRAAVGADRWMLARQSALEAAVITVVGCGLGLALAIALTSTANQLFADELANAPARIDLRVVVGFVALALVATAAIGLSPALLASRVGPMASLRGDAKSTASRASRRVRRALVGAQIAITAVLLIGAIAMIRTVAQLQAVDVGADEGSVSAQAVFPRTPVEQRAAFARELVERTAHLPGVTAAAIASDVPFGRDQMSLAVTLEPGAAVEHPIVRLRLVGPGYFAALGIAMSSGRAFAPGDAADGVHRAIVSAAFAQQYLGHGQRVKIGGDDWYDIIGVAADALDTNVAEPAPAMVYADAEMPAAIEIMGGTFTLVARGEHTDALASAIASLARGSLYDVATLGERVHASYRRQTVLEQLLAAFALAAILVAMIGLYGVTSYAAVERTAEIGIRRALGATRLAIVQLILADTAVIVGAGLAAGLACAWAGRSLLAGIDISTCAIACAGIAAVALLSALIPAWTAARVSPRVAISGGA